MQEPADFTLVFDNQYAIRGHMSPGELLFQLIDDLIILLAL
jgi:hypothetical protein